MIAGRLNEPIKIFHPTVNYNEFGEANEEYKEVYTTRAKVDHNSGTRTVENNEIVFDYNKPSMYVHMYLFAMMTE